MHDGQSIKSDPLRHRPVRDEQWSFVATDDDDTIYRLGGDDRLYGGGGWDDFYGGLGADYINGGTGNDEELYLDSTVAVGIWGPATASAARRKATGLSASSQPLVRSFDLAGNELANIIFGNAGSNTLKDGFGNDTLDRARRPAAGAFVIGPEATTDEHRIIYDSATGAL